MEKKNEKKNNEKLYNKYGLLLFVYMLSSPKQQRNHNGRASNRK